jgi:predicted nucleic acid-binding protein
MRPLLDTNVLVDVALRRPGLHEGSGATVAWCLNNPGSGLLAVHSLATFSYLFGRATGSAKAREFIADLIEGTDIAASTIPRSSERWPCPWLISRTR